MVRFAQAQSRFGSDAEDLPSQRRSLIVGRGAERTAIERLLASVEHDRGPAVLEVVGEPGIGKTTLLEGVGEPRSSRRLVLRGRAAEFESDLPYGLFVDALDAHLVGVTQGRHPKLDEDGLAELAGVFPSLEREVAAPIVVVREERFRFHRAVRALLEQLAGSGSLVLALDDIHFADPASCELLASLVRRPPSCPLLLALAYRSGRGPPAVVTELIAATRAERAHRIEVGPLSQDESNELMAGEEISEGWRVSLYAQSGGNPFYLEQLLRSRRLVAERPAGPAPPASGTGSFGGRPYTLSGRVSEEVAVAIAREVGALPRLAQAVLQAAAVAGEPFEPDLVAEIADVAEPDALRSLDELQTRDLIRPTAVAREFRFRHPLVRAAVYGSLKGGWRVAAHARAARALALRGASAAACAPHVEQSARRGDDEAISLLVEAARTATGRAPASAARWLAAAVRLVPERGPGSERRLELMPELAGAFASIGALEQCQEILLQALDLLPDATDELRTALIAGCAQAEIFLGRYEQARARLVHALGEVGEEISPARVQLELALAAYGTYANDFDLAVRSAASARVHASELGRQALHATALSILSLSSYAAGEIADAEDAHSSACALVDELSDGSISRRVEMMWFLGWAGWFLGRYGAAEAHFARGIAVSRAYGDARLLIEMTVGHAIALTWLGRLGEAVALSEEALEAGQLSNSPNRLMWCNIARCLSLTAAGDLDAALPAGEEAVAIARELGVSVVSAGAGWTCAAALIEGGEHQRAVDVLLELLGGPELSGYFAGMRPFCYGLLTRAETRRGNAAGARDWAQRSAASAGQIGLALGRAHSDLALAEANLRDDAAVAAGLALRAAEAFDRTGAPINAARAWLVAGKALGASGDRERAGDELRRAEQSFAEFGARRLQAEAVRELRRIGRRVRSTGRRGAGAMGGAGSSDELASLSGREREVAELVTARKTNREIAADLYLSEKTIESHLSSVFVKLGVNSRTDVAHTVERTRAQRRFE